MKYLRRILSPLLVTVVTVFSFVSQSPCAEDETALLGERRYIRAGHSANNFSSEVDKNDAKIALEVWLKIIQKKLIKNYNLETIIFDDLDSLEKAVLAGDIDMISLTGLDYLKLEKDDIMEPALIGVTGEGAERKFVILVRKDSGIKKLSQLRGKKVFAESGSGGQICLVWADVSLMQEGFPEAKVFFGSFTQVEKVSKAVLAVFFRQADACIVGQEAFDTMAELNPQVGREIIILASSVPYLDNIVSFRKGYNKEWREDVTKTALRFDEEPEGQQVLMLFRKTKIVPHKPEYLENIRTLQKDYERLKAKR